MPTTDNAALPAVDLLNQPLAEGDRIVFLSRDPHGLCTGTIKMTGYNTWTQKQIVVESGHLLVLQGEHQRPNQQPECIKFSQVVRQPAGDGS